MNLIRFTLLFLLASIVFVSIDTDPASACKRRKKKKKNETAFTVSGVITQTSSYCGGARPPEHLIERLRTPSPLEGAEVAVRAGAENGGKIIATTTTDSLGRFSFQLPAGNYCIVTKEKISPLVIPANTEYETWDKACLEKNWKSCDLEVKVIDKNVDTLNFNIHKNCNWNKPCLTYKGPLPG